MICDLTKSSLRTSSNNLSKKSGQYVVSYNGKIDVIDPIDCYTIDTDYLDKTWARIDNRPTAPGYFREDT